MFNVSNGIPVFNSVNTCINYGINCIRDLSVMLVFRFFIERYAGKFGLYCYTSMNGIPLDSAFKNIPD